MWVLEKTFLSCETCVLSNCFFLNNKTCLKYLFRKYHKLIIFWFWNWCVTPEWSPQEDPKSLNKKYFQDIYKLHYPVSVIIYKTFITVRRYISKSSTECHKWSRARYIPFMVITIRPFPHSWLITAFVTRVIRRMPRLEHVCTNQLIFVGYFDSCSLLIMTANLFASYRFRATSTFFSMATLDICWYLLQKT